MPALDEILQQKLQSLEKKHSLRHIKNTRRSAGVMVERNGKQLVSFSCNDYLGLSQHPQVIAAARGALETYSNGAGSSRLVTGNHPLYDELERALAVYKGTQAACIFGSGYLANLGVIPAVMGSGDLILADKLSHACMLDGARLSGATLMRFAHNNADHCRMLLEAHRHEHRNCLILTETVFSMDGDRAPLAELKTLATRFDVWLMTDDAHSIDISYEKIDIQMGTLSKAFGSYGGYVCGSQSLVDYIKTSARSLVYTTGLPPATVAGALAAIRIMMSSPELAARPLQHARLFTALLNLPEAQSAIVPLVLHDNDKALKTSALLEEHGFLVTAIRPPTVPEGSARLRFTFSALHTEDQIVALSRLVKSHVTL